MRRARSAGKGKGSGPMHVADKGRDETHAESECIYRLQKIFPIGATR